MRKAAMLALVVTGSFFVVYNGMSQPKAKSEKPEIECCDKPGPEPAGISEKCCEPNCG